MPAIEDEPEPLLKAEACTLAKLFSGGRVFRIPSYQRPYCWTEAHVGQLLSDVIRMLPDPYREQSPAAGYFLGNVIVVDQPGSPVLDIVDGQQRTKTLLMLFSVLRDLLGEEPNGRLDRIVHPETGVPGHAAAACRLIPRDRDRRILIDQILAREATFRQPDDLNAEIPGFSDDPDMAFDADELTESQLNYLANRDHIKAWLEPLMEAELRRIANYLLDHCLVLLVSVPNLNDACRVFTVLHTRGMPLSFTDVVKADFLGKLAAEARDEVSAVWEEHEVRLGRAKFAELLQQIYAMRTGRDLDPLTPATTFIAEFSAVDDPRLLVTRDLANAAAALRLIHSTRLGDGPEYAQCNRLLAYLAWVEHPDWTTAVLRWLIANPDRPAETEDFLQRLERFAFGLFILFPNDEARYEKRYRAVMEALRLQPNAVPRAELKLSDAELSSISKKLRENRLHGKRFCRPLLLRLNAIAHGPAADFERRIEVTTVEHILPQSPNKKSHWRAAFAGQAGRFKGLLISSQLGNLTLLTEVENSIAGAKEFTEKRKIYARSEFPLTRPLANAKAWNPESLDKRTDALLAQLLNDWAF